MSKRMRSILRRLRASAAKTSRSSTAWTAVLCTLVVAAVFTSAIMHRARPFAFEVNGVRVSKYEELRKMLDGRDAEAHAAAQEFVTNLHAVRDEAMTRSSHFEELLVALGGFVLGIAAFLGTTVFKTADPDQMAVANPQRFFWLSMVLLGATAAAYMHVFRIYTAYGILVVQVERLAFPPGLRPLANVFGYAMDPNIAWFAKPPFITADFTFSVVAMYPMTILTGGVVVFGRRLGVPWRRLWIFLILIFTWTLLYVGPVVTEFFRLEMSART